MAHLSGSSAEDVVEYVRETSSRLHDLEAQCRHLTAALNTLQLRLDSLETELDQAKGQLAGTQGVDLPTRVNALTRVVTELVSVSNRVEPEVLKLLQWRRQFVASLQQQLQYLGHQFWLFAPDSIWTNWIRAGTELCPNAVSRTSLLITSFWIFDQSGFPCLGARVFFGLSFRSSAVVNPCCPSPVLRRDSSLVGARQCSRLLRRPCLRLLMLLLGRGPALLLLLNLRIQCVLRLCGKSRP